MPIAKVDPTFVKHPILVLKDLYYITGMGLGAWGVWCKDWGV